MTDWDAALNAMGIKRATAPIAADPKSMSREELMAEMSSIIALKAWGLRYFAINREIQNRATAHWVRGDVFGATFDDGQGWK